MPNTLPPRQEILYQGDGSYNIVIDYDNEFVSVEGFDGMPIQYPIKLFMHVGALIIARMESEDA